VIIAQDQCLSVYMRQKILKDNTKRWLKIKLDSNRQKDWY
jgi:hypothetical protein